MSPVSDYYPLQLAFFQPIKEHMELQLFHLKSTEINKYGW